MANCECHNQMVVEPENRSEGGRKLPSRKIIRKHVFPKLHLKILQTSGLDVFQEIDEGYKPGPWWWPLLLCSLASCDPPVIKHSNQMR